LQIVWYHERKKQSVITDWYIFLFAKHFAFETQKNFPPNSGYVLLPWIDLSLTSALADNLRCAPQLMVVVVSSVSVEEESGAGAFALTMGA